MKTLPVLLSSFLWLACNCAPATPPPQPIPQDAPEWMRKVIHKLEDEAAANPPASLWRYDYRGNVVYFVPERCCDLTSALYDADGNIICLPSGGIAGGGDGRCPDFIDERTNGVLLWQDPRMPGQK